MITKSKLIVPLLMAGAAAMAVPAVSNGNMETINKNTKGFVKSLQAANYKLQTPFLVPSGKIRSILLSFNAPPHI